MADILKITTPLVDKNPIQPNKQVTDPTVPFNLADISKVIKPGQESEILKQNNGMIQKEEAPTILMNMLKDPSATVGFLRNVYMLQEIIKLLPINNTTLTQEIQQLFQDLLIKPDEVVAELMRQADSSTSFRGELFDFLRTLIEQTPKPEMRYGVTNLLKSLNAMFTRQNILRSVSNSLTFISDSLRTSKDLSQRIANLAQRFRVDDAGEQFHQLKDETLMLLKEMESNILYTPKLMKIAPMVVYNLSRYNDNPDFLHEALGSLLTLVDGSDQKDQLVLLVRQFLEQGGIKPGDDSRVMEVLTKIIGKQSEDAELNLLNSEKLDRIVHSLLSSPCNFTPLLHFIIPVEFMDMKSFAEIWVDPNGDDPVAGASGGESDIHMLVVFDVEGIGRFEAEMMVKDYNITLNLYCPPAYVAAFSGVGSAISQAMANSDYRFSDVRVDKLDRQRSLMDVFKSLPHKRTGVDVTV